MSRLVAVLVLCSTAAVAAEVEVPLGGRAPLPAGRRTVHEVLVRDPSMLTVVVTEGAVSLEGKKHGTTGVTVKYSDGELERLLVIVGNATNEKGPRMERSQNVDVKPNVTAQAKAAAPAPKPKSKERAAIQDASDVVRAAVEAL